MLIKFDAAEKFEAGDSVSISGWFDVGVGFAEKFEDGDTVSISGWFDVGVGFSPGRKNSNRITFYP